MSDNAVTRLWDKVRAWFDADAVHLHCLRFDETDAASLRPNDSYLRIVISELFVRDSVRWSRERYPAVQAAAKLAYGGRQPVTFATLARPEESQLGPGVFQDYELTYLVPYLGQSVEIEVSLFEILGENRLGTALDVLGEFATLVAPPLSAVVPVMDKIASGIDKVITANGTAPVLALHGMLSPTGADSGGLRPGWIAVIRATQDVLPREQLRIVGGRLHRLTGPTTSEPLAGFDFAVVRVEGKQSRAVDSDWLAPDIDKALSDARFARDTGTAEEFADARKALLGAVYYSPDFSPADRKRVAQLVKEEIDDATAGAAGGGEDTISSLVARRGLPSPADVEELDFETLIG